MTDTPEGTDALCYLDEQRRAEASARAMLAGDAASRLVGIALERVSPGFARMRMDVTESMMNGHGICHGGYLFMFADTTFAVACNTFNRVTVATSAQIEFLASVHLGDVLYAEGSMLSQGRRAGIYDVVVENDKGRQVALFRGRSHRLDETLFDEVDAQRRGQCP